MQLITSNYLSSPNLLKCIVSVTEIFQELSHLQTGEKIGQFNEERKENKADESSLRRRFGHFVSIHERSDRKTLQLLHVTLDKDVKTLR